MSNYDIPAEAKRISQIDNPIARRQALEKVPSPYRKAVEVQVIGLVRARIAR
jgi:hypothetical protein